ncbi:MAG: TIGR02099 family protein [Betaproteobacteria bacterium]|nr:TIGR02099 family protein [Betaproteobacteria bacterium]
MRIPPQGRVLGKLSPSLLRSLVRLLVDLMVLGIALFALLLLALRFAILPKIENYRPQIVAALSDAVGHPVSIGQLRAGWDGWNPTLGLTELTIRARSGEALLTLPDVAATLSWQSLARFNLHLKALVLERPSLLIRRTSEGRFSIGGLEVDPASTETDAGFADWLMRQRRVEILDALLIWQDDYRQAPQLLLDRVSFRLENRFGDHRFGLVGTPPPEIAGPIDVRGDFSGDSLRAWEQLEGRAYVRLDYADVATWREWLPLPAQFARGEGALRLWFGFAQGLPRDFTADLELREVAGSLEAGLPALRLKRLSGRLAWRGDADIQEVSAKNLVIEAPGANTAEPLDFVLKLRRQAEAWSGGEMRVNVLDLAAMGILANHLPLPENLRQEIKERAPRGVIRNAQWSWKGAFEEPELTLLKAEFSGLGLSSAGGEPGFTNFSGKVEGDSRRGSLQLASRAATLELPGVFAAPLRLETLASKATWRREGATVLVQLGELEFANAHAAGSASGEYRSAEGGPGSIDLKAKLSRADPRSVHLYLPLVVGEQTRQYLKRALTGGQARDARLTLRGDLAHFPFDDAEKGLFEIRVRAEGASMEYAPGWPEFENVRADLLFRGSRMEITSNAAESMGVRLANVNVAIPDLGAKEPVLQVRGEALGATADFLRFVETSPVLGMIDRFTEGMQASGSGKLELKLAIPLAKPEDTKVVGEFAIVDNQIIVSRDIPPLEKANGRIRFTDRDVRAEGISAEMLGGPVQGLVASAEGSVRITARGTANADELSRTYNSPLLRSISGRSDWQAEVRVRGGRAQWAVDSSLRGVRLDLPAPLAKAPDEPLPLRLEHRDLDNGKTLFGVSLGSRLEYQMVRAPEATGGRLAFERAFLALDGAPVDLSQTGLWVRGEIGELDLDRWLEYRPDAEGPPAPADGSWPGSADLAGLDLKLGAATVLDRRFEELRLSAAAKGGKVNMNLSSRQLAGMLAWSPPTASQPNGQLVGRFQRLVLPAAQNAGAGEGEAGQDAPPSSAADDWPAVDLIAENFSTKGRALGKLELKASAEGRNWKLERLRLVNPDGTLEASGKWSISGRQQRTEAELKLDIREAGPYLARFGMPDAVKAAPTKLAGTLTWAGPPNDLDYASLAGKLKLEVGKGQFTKIEPGIGKLLGVLSLQALPRRLTLDFGDIFSSGFAFDALSGEISIENGVMATEKLLLDGTSARVEIRGRANLAAETQDLRVKVFPSLATSAALTAGFAVNPVAGGVTWLVSKVLKDPLDRLFAYEYQVSGAWSDPQVTNVVANDAAANANPGATQ